jgi:hypothetical protein
MNSKLMEAIARGDLVLASKAIREGCIVPDGRAVLLAASCAGPSMLALLARSGAAPLESFPEGSALHAAALSGNLDAIAFLLELGADPEARDAHGETPMDLAIRNGQARAADLMESARTRTREKTAG